jgi:hypothetical protein
MSVSGAAMSGAPWGAATVTGGVIAAGDLGLHIIGGFHLGLSSLSGSLAMGAVAFFVVAAAGALWRARSGRVVTGGGVIDGVLSGLWHGGLVYGLTGVAGVTKRSRQSAS